MGTITVFPARKVVTMDPGRPVAEAEAVMDGKVLSTGSLRALRSNVTLRKRSRGSATFPSTERA
jgi:predicted amidohydrolase YtcJ